MVKRYSFGQPIETDAVKLKPHTEEWNNAVLDKKENIFYYKLHENEQVYGLGETVRGINKRGWCYISDCADDPDHSEDKNSLYGAHNFIAFGFEKEKYYGLFIDTPSKVIFDIGYSCNDLMEIEIDSDHYEIYLLENDSYLNLIQEFRKLIGQSYVAPKWAFGYGQSRWSYETSEEVREVVKLHKKNHIPLDSVYLDIDYMERYKDFTINRQTFPDFEDLVAELKKQNIHLVPIIDGGVKKEEGYEVYEEGKEKGYFCKDEQDEDFVVGVWPGKCCFPDMLNEEAGAWFGDKYKILLEKGIDGFWNDMNEPAIFYSEKRLGKVFEKFSKYQNENLDVNTFFEMTNLIATISNNKEDYASFYHNYKGKKYCHNKVHNLFGYCMTKSAAKAFKRYQPDKRILLFSRASYIGMHRYGGIWQGDNKAWWSHLEMNIKMMPSLNMCGFLYTGADIGGFGTDTTEDLLIRWLEFAVFTPLMRNHSARGTRRQEVYQFTNVEKFRDVIAVRYKILPYIYCEYMKAVLKNTMMFIPLAFIYKDDQIAAQIEDQLLIGDNIMIAPVYKQNATGRMVYFPERMKHIIFVEDKIIENEVYEKGISYVEMPKGTVHIYLREGYLIPISDGGENVSQVDFENVKTYSFGKNLKPYEYYSDNGETRDYDLERNITILN